MLPFLSLLDWQIGHTQIQPLLLKISQVYQLPRCSHVPLIFSFALLALHCINGRGSFQEPNLPNPGSPQAWLPFADALLQTAHCKLNGFSSALQFLFPHPIPHCLTFACFSVWKELM